MSKIGPHAILGTAPAVAWAKTAPIVKALDNLAVLEAAPPNAIRVFRHFLPVQNLDDPQGTVGAILGALGGYRHPNLFCELWNEAKPPLASLQTAVTLMHQAGVKCCGASWSTGNYSGADFAEARTAGVDAYNLHCYWGNQGFTLWEALRYRQFSIDATVPVLITECGRDAVEGGLGGWIKDGLTPQQYAAELLAYDAEIAKDSYVLGATPFTSGPTPDWSNFDMDPVSPLLVTPAYSVGPGVAAKLAAEGDTATSDELYLGNEMSFTTGHKGLYIYSKGGNETLFLARTS